MGETALAIDRKKVCLFIPPGLKDFKLKLFERIGQKIGHVVRDDHLLLDQLPEDVIPIVGCTPELRPLVDRWRETKRPFVYWDRGYARRVFATWLPRGDNGGYYRWHLNSFQMRRIRQVPPDRWLALKTDVASWSKGGRHIVIAAPTRTYTRFHRIESWIGDTLDALARFTDRQVIIRDKEFRRPLQADLLDAHCLIAHGSNTAVEAAILGCPVFVHPESAAALVGRTDLRQVESPVYPERLPWLYSLAYSQFSEVELVDGTLWKLIDEGGAT